MTQYRLRESPQSFIHESPQSFLHGVVQLVGNFETNVADYDQIATAEIRRFLCPPDISEFINFVGDTVHSLQFISLNLGEPDFLPGQEITIQGLTSGAELKFTLSCVDWPGFKFTKQNEPVSKGNWEGAGFTRLPAVPTGALQLNYDWVNRTPPTPRFIFEEECLVTQAPP